MGFSFDGTTKVVSLTAGTTSLDAADLYSAWKDWVLVGDNAKYLQGMSVVGGDPISSTNSIAPYFFLTNGWRVKPQEAHHQLEVEGALLTDTGDEPFIPTTGVYRVLVRHTVPVRAEGVFTTGGGGGGDPEEIATEVLDTQQVETGVSVRQALRLLAAALAGKVSGAGTGQITIRNAVADDTDRIVATVDAAGNRLTVEVDLE